jgi:hypothetical protein
VTKGENAHFMKTERGIFLLKGAPWSPRESRFAPVAPIQTPSLFSDAQLFATPFHPHPEKVAGASRDAPL